MVSGLMEMCDGLASHAFYACLMLMISQKNIANCKQDLGIFSQKACHKSVAYQTPAQKACKFVLSCCIYYIGLVLRR